MIVRDNIGEIDYQNLRCWKLLSLQDSNQIVDDVIMFTYSRLRPTHQSIRLSVENVYESG